MKSLAFTSRLENFDTALWTWHIKVPKPIADTLAAEGIKRMVCRLNDTMTIHCALMPSGDGGHFILMNKKVRDALRLKEGSPVQAEVSADTSDYGIEPSEEMRACLADDPEGDRYFHALTPGKQRSLIYFVGQVKDPDKRIVRALTILEHLKGNDGKLDFRQLNADLKAARNG